MTAAMPAQADALAAIAAAMKLRDAEALEAALDHVFAAGLLGSLCDALIILAEASWHKRHEDVARALQILRCPKAVAALERTAVAHHAYLDFDDALGLARKCTWALADIGTPEARAALTRLSTAGNDLIAGYARKRVERWEQELARKGGGG